MVTLRQKKIVTEKDFISVDIGSTWTKAARFVADSDHFILERRSVVPTSVDYLPNGFFEALKQVDVNVGLQGNDQNLPPVFFSSSARGGLRVAVVGLVPEMTLHIARLAAFSAGARVCAAFQYRLNKRNIGQIEQEQPDILLLCGGTNGGNERYVRENSMALAASNFEGTIIYAGNNQVEDEIAEILAEKDLRFSENIMPDFGQLNLEPARSKIREVFLDRIVSGKGLDALVTRFGIQPVPTPLAVFNLVEAIGKYRDDWQNFALIDMGGATTDFYSFSDSYHPDSGTVLKGVLEPKAKRTVEGDLGMRVSANSVLSLAESMFENELAQYDLKLNLMSEYIEKLNHNPSHLPDRKNANEMLFDQLLAKACINNAMLRHAGSVEEVFTTSGPVLAQRGKDLRKIDKIVGSGGYLAASDHIWNSSVSLQQDSESSLKKPLFPTDFSYYVDADYLWPLLGNLAAAYPLQAANTAVASLKLKQNNHKIKVLNNPALVNRNCCSTITQGAHS
jgi:uncharacterized protein (TIGR01319 family)